MFKRNWHLESHPQAEPGPGCGWQTLSFSALLYTPPSTYGYDSSCETNDDRIKTFGQDIKFDPFLERSSNA